MALRPLLLCLLLWLMALPGLALADSARFDLAGPRLQVTVTHAGVTLPISQVPNLAAGDQLSIKTELPAGQSVRYLLVAGFLRGATNPPPREWFSRAETWTLKGRDGLKVTVPQGAQQVLLFLAPQTGGDFKTLVGAVRGRPGAFVRAAQDLNQAALDRSRLDAFLAGISKADPADPERLKTVSPLLARSLMVKLNADCLLKMPELQAACLTQEQDQLVLNDGHSASIVEGLTSGHLADLTAQLSVTPQARYGYYSPYIGALADIARILDTLHTAQYQYIPALATLREDRLALLLNTAPSFHKPMSVLVVALPAVEPPQPPPLQPVEPKLAWCGARTDLVLPVEGAPLVYSTGYAHDMALRLKALDGRTVQLPVKADADKGGLVVDAARFSSADFGDTADAALHGTWGFEPFQGPTFHLQAPQVQGWKISADDMDALVVGRDDVVHLEGKAASCVRSLKLAQAGEEPLTPTWKVVAPDRLELTAPLANAQPGPMTLQVDQYGLKAPVAVPVQAYAQARKFDSFTLHAGDALGVMKGTRLDEVARLTLGGVDFDPGVLVGSGGGDELPLRTTSPDVAKLKAGQGMTAKVKLKDGRSVNLRGRIAPARPQATLIDKTVAAPDQGATAGKVRLTDPNELPQNARLTFSVRATAPATFSGDEAIEVATADGAFSTRLTVASGLTIVDAQVALATLDTAKAFNASAFGSLRFRIVDASGAGDWQPLAVLVRLPVVEAVKCDAGPERPCQLTGTNLFLIEAVSDEPGFEQPTRVPEGFPGSALAVPHPREGKLYLKLRDNPEAVNELALPAAGKAPGQPTGRSGRLAGWQAEASDEVCAGCWTIGASAVRRHHRVC